MPTSYCSELQGTLRLAGMTLSTWTANSLSRTNSSTARRLLALAGSVFAPPPMLPLEQMTTSLACLEEPTRFVVVATPPQPEFPALHNSAIESVPVFI
mmetsp:Transcript_28060/g.64456  ORF Transcript_28060/g.64456 Transcript_28060/m.64456 type:complete len:98 (+) Transcript_28060:962-1255(+)